MKTNYVFYVDRLRGEYKEAFKTIELYAAVNNITGDFLEKRMMELIDLMIRARDNGDGIEKVIEKPMKEFCREYFKDYSPKNRLGEFARSIYRVAWLIFIIESIPMVSILKGGDLRILKERGDMIPILVGAGGAIFTSSLLNILMRKIIFKIKRVSYVTYSIFSFICTLAVVYFAINLFNNFNIAIPRVVVLGSSLGYIIFYMVLSLIYRKNRGKVLNYSKKKIKSQMKVHSNEDLKRQLAEVFIKRYHRLNKKRLKKGKEPLTKEEFMTILLKENEKLRKGNIVGGIFVVFIVGGFILNVALTSTLMNTIIFILVILAIEIPLVYSTIIKSIQGKDIRTEMFKEMDTRNMDVFQYLEKN